MLHERTFYSGVKFAGWLIALPDKTLCNTDPGLSAGKSAVATRQGWYTRASFATIDDIDDDRQRHASKPSSRLLGHQQEHGRLL